VVELIEDYLCGLVTVVELPPLFQQCAEEQQVADWLTSGMFEGTLKPAVHWWISDVARRAARVDTTAAFQQSLSRRLMELHEALAHWNAPPGVVGFKTVSAGSALSAEKSLSPYDASKSSAVSSGSAATAGEAYRGAVSAAGGESSSVTVKLSYEDGLGTSADVGASDEDNDPVACGNSVLDNAKPSSAPDKSFHESTDSSPPAPRKSKSTPELSLTTPKPTGPHGEKQPTDTTVEKVSNDAPHKPFNKKHHDNLFELAGKSTWPSQGVYY
jgi:hypothetical protein